MPNILAELRDKMAKDQFGKTVPEALEAGVCLDCGEDALANCYSEAGCREYKISGLCEKCFDRITMPGEDN